MPSDNTKVSDKEDLGDAIRAAFAKPATGEGQLVAYQQPGTVTISDAIITAQKVAVERDEGKVLAKIRTLANAVGEEFFYRFPVKSRGQTNWIEGPSIKCANNVARLYGNCQVDTRIVDNGDSWIIYAKFVDYETGFSYTRPFQQRKNQGSIRGDADRQLDIALQIGISKAIRNVICNALETFTNYAFEEAKSAIVAKVGKNLDAYRDRVIGRLTEMKVDLHRVDFAIGRASKDWLAPDVARIITQLQAINDGMATVDETWPPTAGGTAPPRPTREEFKETPIQTEAVEPFIVTDMRGDEFTMADLDHAVDAYRSILDAAEKQGEAALSTAIDNNGPFFNQLDERGHTELSRDLSLEGGKRLEAVREKAVPRGTVESNSSPTIENTELRSSDAAERQDATDDLPPTSTARPGEAPPAARDTPPQTPSPATPPQPERKVTVSADHTQPGLLSSANPDATIPVAGDPPLERDAKFWSRKDGSKRLLATDHDGFMLEIPIRLAECREWDDVDYIERANRPAINKLDTEDRVTLSGLFAKRREELRGG